jgi:FemAB-related protein (PEP-CTERM system-associated)
MRIEYLNDTEGHRWDSYVGARASAVTDLFAWRFVVRDAYGIRSHFVVAVENEQIVGGLSLFELKHPLFGHYLSTAVFGTDGGLHFESAAARDAVIAEAKALAGRLGVAHLLIRTRGLELDGFVTDARYRTAVVDLDGTAEEAWARLPGKTRNQVRRGMKEGFTVAKGHDQLDAFYDVFHEHMRDLGSPAHGMPFYRAIVAHLGARADFIVVRDGNAPVAGALLFRVNETAMNYHTVALHRYNPRCPNYLLYWRMLEMSYAYGLRRFDMARSEAESSQLRFKQNWGPREIELRYNYFLVKGKALPRLDPNNPKFRMAIQVWQRSPLAITRLVGPRLIAGLA